LIELKIPETGKAEVGKGGVGGERSSPGKKISYPVEEGFESLASLLANQWICIRGGGEVDVHIN